MKPWGRFGEKRPFCRMDPDPFCRGLATTDCPTVNTPQCGMNIETPTAIPDAVSLYWGSKFNAGVVLPHRSEGPWHKGK